MKRIRQELHTVTRSARYRSKGHESEIEGRGRRIREASMSRQKGWVNEAAICDRVDMRNVQG